MLELRHCIHQMSRPRVSTRAGLDGGLHLGACLLLRGLLGVRNGLTYGTPQYLGLRLCNRRCLRVHRRRLRRQLLLLPPLPSLKSLRRLVLRLAG